MWNRLGYGIDSDSNWSFLCNKLPCAHFCNFLLHSEPTPTICLRKIFTDRLFFKKVHFFPFRKPTRVFCFIMSESAIRDLFLQECSSVKVRLCVSASQQIHRKIGIMWRNSMTLYDKLVSYINYDLTHILKYRPLAAVPGTRYCCYHECWWIYIFSLNNVEHVTCSFFFPFRNVPQV